MIPWGQIITTSISLADVAHTLYKKTRKRSKPKDEKDNTEANALLQRIEELEILQADQASLFQQMADQNKMLIRKVRNSYIISILALILSLLSLILLGISAFQM